MTTNFLQITPFMHVPNLKAALAFFTDILGFAVLVEMGDYAYVEREGVGLRLMQNRGDDGAPPGNGQRELLVLAPDGNLLAFGQAM